MAKQQSEELRVNGQPVKPEVAKACQLIGVPVTRSPRRTSGSAKRPGKNRGA